MILIDDNTQDENCWLILYPKFLASFDLRKLVPKSHHLNVVQYFMEVLHPVHFLCIRPFKTGRDGEMQHYRKARKVFQSDFIALFLISYFHNVALWGLQSNNSNALCISSDFKCQDQRSASKGLCWVADYTIKMLTEKWPLSPSSPERRW